MTKFIRAVMFAVIMTGFIGDIVVNPNVSVANDVDKIIAKAKEIVRDTVDYPDTLVFHVCYTKVNGNIVTLKFTAKNAFGVPETHIKDIKVN